MSLDTKLLGHIFYLLLIWVKKGLQKEQVSIKFSFADF